MDFSEIKNVSDLIEANNEAKDESDVIRELLAPVFKEDPSIGMKCAVQILTELMCLHHDIMEQGLDEKDAEKATLWGIDMNRIDDAITILKSVKL